MIRLVSAGERGEDVVVKMTVFDLVSLMNDEMYAVVKMESSKEESEATAKAEGKTESSWEILGLEGRLKDARANYKELEAIHEQVNKDRYGKGTNE